MLNVRIASLPPDRQIAGKDCRRCIKRRIKCDRSVPRCRKCTIREFQCPGYDAVQLKWSSGVSRINKTSTKPSSNQLQDGSRDTGPSATSAAVSHVKLPPKGRHVERQVPWTEQCRSPTSVEGTPSPLTDRSLVNNYTTAILSHNLFTHFNIKVAPRLTWVDRPDHPWRKVIAPLAQRSPCLGLSILSVAAAHISFTSSDPTTTTDTTRSMISRRLRDASLHSLNRKINIELANYHPTPDFTSRDSILIEILATTLVLCYGEMLIPHSTDWNLHLHACRLLIERYTWRNKHDEHPNPAIDFIIREVADIEVFRNIGAFSIEQSFSTDFLRPQSMILDDYFHTFTGVFREITAEERKRHALYQQTKENQSQGSLLPPIDMGPWRAKVDLAYTRASTDTARLIITHGANTRKWMEAIVRAVYHASMIYAYQALAPISEATTEVRISLPLLLAEIEFLTAGPVHSFSHDLFVPLFIAGTECWNDTARQGDVEKRFRDLLAAMGIWCNYTALRFLKAFWEEGDYHRVGGWIPYARENEADNGAFLVF